MKSDHDGDGDADDALGQSNSIPRRGGGGGPRWNLRCCVMTWTSAASIPSRPRLTHCSHLAMDGLLRASFTVSSRLRKRILFSIVA